MLRMRKWKLWAQVGMAFLCLGLIAGCTVDVTGDVTEQTLSSIVSAKAVTNLEASTTEENQITVSFTGQNDADELHIRYLLNYQFFDGPNAISTTETHTIIPKSGETEFTYTMPVNSGIHVLYSVQTVITYGDKSVSTAQTSDVVEGAALPSVSLSAPIVEGNDVYLAWDDRALMSAKDQNGRTPLYDNYEFELYRIRVPEDFNLAGKTQEELDTYWVEHGKAIYSGKDTTFKDKLEGRQVQAIYRLGLKILDKNNEPIEGVKEATSPTSMIKTDSSLASVPATSVSVTQGTEQNKVIITVLLPDYVVTDGTVTHRMKLERSVHGTNTWTTLVPYTEDINTDAYKYFQYSEGGGASYIVDDTNVEANTLYDYRVTTGYLYSVTGTIQTQDPETALTETVEPGYKMWLPSGDLVLEDKRAKASDEQMDTLVTWTYDPPVAAERTFVLTRSDEFSSTSFEVTGTQYEDVFDITGDDVNYNHTYYYSLVMKYPDDTLSSPPVTSATSVVFESPYVSVNFVKDLTATQSLAGKVVLTWTEDHSGDVAYESSDISYKLKQADSYKELNGADFEDLFGSDTTSKPSADNNYQGSLTLDGLDDGVTKYYLLRADYGGNATINKLSYSNTSGKTLANPANLSASDGASTEELTLTFDQVEDARGYQLLYRKEGSEDEWTTLDIEKPDDGSETITQVLGDEVGKNTKLAGTRYVFKVKSKDVDDVYTQGSSEETGSLLGPALLNAKVIDNDQYNDHFTLTWDPVDGAKGYNLYVYTAGSGVHDATTKVGERLIEDVQKTTAKFTLDKTDAEYVDLLFDKKGNNPYPLSSHYDILIAPYNDNFEVEENLIDPVEGHWFTPPVLEASKATSGTQITLTWNAVEGATEYKVYSSTDNASWVLLDTTSGTSMDVPTNADTYFTITASNGTVTSLKQEYAADDKANFGYVFKAPGSFSATSDPDHPWYVLSWSAVESATKYYLKEDNQDAIAVDVGSMTAGSSIGSKDSAGYLTLSEDGRTFTWYSQGNEMTSPVWSHTVSMYSEKTLDDGTVITSLNTPTVTGIYRDFTPKELCNIMNFMLYAALHNADESFGGDWWPPSGVAEIGFKEHNYYIQTYSTMAGVTVTSSHADGPHVLGIIQRDGNITFSDAPIPHGRDQLGNLSGFKVSASQAATVRASDDGELGYLGNDKLQLVGKDGTGSFTITYPDKYGSRTAVYQITTQLDVQAKTGEVKITKDGTETSFSYVDMTTKPW